MEYLFLIILLVFMIGMMFFQTRKAKQQQEERKNFWSNLAPGTEIVTIGGLIGKVVEVDEQYEEIVIDSEGTLLRFTFRAINREYVRPAYVSDDDVDEDGNPIDHNADQQGEPEQIETTVEETVTETDDDDQAPMPKQ
ncbi:preprotein translocase subunit YajC [Bifidobacterium pseudolongum]|uniref:preprotein translocase subunit YajC n=1 Tax=Bifidobacterium pseudolongum TaxID=1694 RepID=UPI00101F60A7|nr:preprotein translocase subunit YajC [Bifidobacterium pseudolongum]